MLNLDGRKVVINEELISMMTSILMEGRKFYKDHKVSDAAIDDFPKEPVEREALVKEEGKTYF